MRIGSSSPEGFQKTIWILGLCLLVGILIYLLMRNTEGISVAVKNDYMSLSYSSGDSFDINYGDILSVTEMQDLNLGQYVSGRETKNYQFGIWENSEFGKYKLCIYADVTRYIVVKTSRDIFVFNFESVDATHNFHKAFLELLQTGQAQATP